MANFVPSNESPDTYLRIRFVTYVSTLSLLSTMLSQFWDAVVVGVGVRSSDSDVLLDECMAWETRNGGATNRPSSIFSIVSSTERVSLRSSVMRFNGSCGNICWTCNIKQLKKNTLRNKSC